MEFPIKTTEYLNGGKTGESDLFDELQEEGWTEQQLESVPRYLVCELELEVEITEDGDTYITHVQGQKLETPIKNA